MASKIIVLLSGGLDSSTLAYYCKSIGLETYGLSFDYGQRHKKELEAAAEICRRAEIPHKIISIPALGNLGGSSQTDASIEVPEGHYEEENMKITVVPNRNMILLAFAAAYAQVIGAETIGLANHAGDHAIYPDCRPGFILGMQTLLQETWGISLKAPFTHLTKSEIVKAGTNLGVPYEITWSCYKGENLHCGKCGTCVERKEAFILANVPDPTLWKS